MLKRLGAMLGLSHAAAQASVDIMSECDDTRRSGMTHEEKVKKLKALKANKAAKKARRRNRR